MAIHTQESLSGFIASDPQLTQTSKGHARFCAWIGKEHFRREEDGSFTQTETTYHHMVMFDRSAEHAHARFAKATTSQPRATPAKSTTSGTGRTSRVRSSSPRSWATTPPAPATRWTAARAVRRSSGRRPGPRRRSGRRRRRSRRR